MDSLTQIVLGASIAEAVAGKKMGNRAPLVGAVCGTIPDLDVFLPYDGLVAYYQGHRGFSHSFLFSFLVAPVLGWLFQKLFQKKNYGFMLWSKLCFWAIVTHPLLDSFTSWGTQLFSPFSNYRVAFNTISVIDPLYTVPFLILVLIVLFTKRTSTKRKYLNRVGLGISSTYLLFTLATKTYVNSVFKDSLHKQNISYVRYSTYPTIFNSFLWKFIGKTSDGFYIGYYSIFDEHADIDFKFVESGNKYIPEDLKNSKGFKALVHIVKNYATRKDKDEFKFYNLNWSLTDDIDGKTAPPLSYISIQKRDGGYTFANQKLSVEKINRASMFGNLVLRIFGFKPSVSSAYQDKAKTSKKTIYDFKVKTIDGEDFDFATLRGKKIMIVNTASECGLTPQYGELEELYRKYKDKGFVIVGFPANNFMGQEPGTNQEIKAFCTQKFSVTFPMMEKISVKGENMHPIYRWLTQDGLRKVKWNFQKFLIGADGYVEKIIAPTQKPKSKEIIEWIEAT